MIARIAVLALVLGTLAPAAGQGRRGAPATPVGEATLRLERLTWTREAALEFDAGGAPGRRTAAGRVELEFRFGARRPEALDGLVPGPSRGTWSARDDRGRAATEIRADLRRDDDGTRLSVILEGLHPEARALVSLQGELPAYPRARRLRFHVPWLKDEVPLTVEVDGGAATLRRFRLVGADSTLWVSVRPPAGFSVAPQGTPGSLQGRAMDIDGNLVNAGGVAEIEQTAAGPEPEFRFHCPGLRRTPSRLMLDVLCVAGEPRGLPFRFTGLPLPPP